MTIDGNYFRLDSRDIELGPDALIERKGRLQYVYGRWDRVFGTWRIAADGVARPHTPTFPIVLRDGEPVGLPAHPGDGWDEYWDCDWQLVELFDGIDYACEISEDSLRSDRILLRAFTNLIPQTIRIAVAPIRNPKYQWILLCALWHEQDLARYLLDEFTAVGTGYVELCLSQSDLTASSPSVAARFVRSCLTRPRAEFLSGLIGVPIRAATIRLLSRLRNTDRLTPETVDAIRRLNEQPELLRLLGNRKAVTCGILRLFVNAAPVFRHARFFHADPQPETADLDLSDQPAWECSTVQVDDDHLEDEHGLALATNLYRRICECAASLPVGWQQELHARIARTTSPHDLAEALECFIGDRIGYCPPWVGDKTTSPIRTSSELRQAALRYANCAFGWNSSLLAGNTAIYLVQSPWPAMVEVKRLGDDRPWRIGQFQFLHPGDDVDSKRNATLRQFALSFRDASGARLADAYRLLSNDGNPGVGAPPPKIDTL